MKFHSNMVYLILLTFILASDVIIKEYVQADNQKITSENEMKFFLDWYDKEICKVVNIQAHLAWNHKTNLTDHNEKLMIDGEIRVNEFKKLIFKNASKFDWHNVKNENIKRQMIYIKMADDGKTVLSESKLKQLLSTEAKMLEIYSKAEICQYISEHSRRECLDDKGVRDIFATSRDEHQLRMIWRKWHETLGRQLRNNFKIYVKLTNELAIKNNYTDMGAYWRRFYESPTLEEDVKNLWEQVKPLYVQLHAYVRKKLIEIYGPELVPRKGLIPAHLLGNIIAYGWGGIDVDLPFQGNIYPDITGEMLKQNYTVKRIIKVAEDFFKSLGFPNMPETFWKNSLFEQPEDGRDVMCHGTAWNFFDRKDYRMLICAKVSAEEFYTMHHELGHLQYFMQYKDQPFQFQNGANPAFHEAIGDVISLSVMTPKHLRSIGLLHEFHDNYESDINYLFTEALSSVSTLPVNYLIERWRWDIFKGKTNEAQFNEEWWRLRYFLSDIIKYQFHRALCKASGQYDLSDPEKPLFKCDIYNSKEAGRILRDMLKLGSSKHWSDAMKVITQGKEDNLDASAILEYFKPLMEYLEEDNKRTNERLGWEDFVKKEEYDSINAGATQPVKDFFLLIFNLFTILVHLMG